MKSGIQNLAPVLRLIPFASIANRLEKVDRDGITCFVVGENDLKVIIGSFLRMIPFDELEYLRSSRDLAIAMAEGRYSGSGKQHFVRYGYFEGRRPFSSFVPASFDEMTAENEHSDEYFELLYDALAAIDAACYMDAERVLKGILAKFPSAGRILRLLAECYARLGRPRLALSYLESFPSDELSARELTIQSSSCMALHLHDDGLRFMQLAAHTKKGADDHLIGQLASLELQRGNFGAARALFTRMAPSRLGGDGIAARALLLRLTKDARTKVKALLKLKRAGTASTQDESTLLLEIARLGFKRVAGSRLNQLVKVSRLSEDLSRDVVRTLVEVARLCRGSRGALNTLSLIKRPGHGIDIGVLEAQFLYATHQYEKCLEQLSAFSLSDWPLTAFQYAFNSALMMGRHEMALGICSEWRQRAPAEASWAVSALTALFDRGTVTDGQVNVTHGDVSDSSLQGDPLIPRFIVQYWNNETVPADVLDCMNGWKVNNPGFLYRRFDDSAAAAFLENVYGTEASKIFLQCSHPAMKADYFRLGLLYELGGCYIDADERSGEPLEKLVRSFEEKTLVLVRNKRMSLFNSPIFCVAKNPIIGRAFEEASKALANTASSETSLNVWQMTGPGLLTRVFVTAILDGEQDLLDKTAIISEWDSSRFSREETFEYKASPAGNWRLRP